VSRGATQQRDGHSQRRLWSLEMARPPVMSCEPSALESDPPPSSVPGGTLGEMSFCLPPIRWPKTPSLFLFLRSRQTDTDCCLIKYLSCIGPKTPSPNHCFFSYRPPFRFLLTPPSERPPSLVLLILPVFFRLGFVVSWSSSLPRPLRLSLFFSRLVSRNPARDPSPPIPSPPVAPSTNPIAVNSVRPSLPVPFSFS